MMIKGKKNSISTDSPTRNTSLHYSRNHKKSQESQFRQLTIREQSLNFKRFTNKKLLFGHRWSAFNDHPGLQRGAWDAVKTTRHIGNSKSKARVLKTITFSSTRGTSNVTHV